MKYFSSIPILFSFLLSCSNSEETTKEAPAKDKSNENIVQLTDAQIQSAGIKTGKSEKRNISEVLKVNGFIDVPPQNIVSISVPMGGYLKSTKLLPGMHVSRGESIAVIEDQQYIQMQQDYLTAQARLHYTEGEYNRQKVLNQSKATSDKLFQQTEADYTSQKILLRSLSEKLKLTGINPEKLNADNLSRSINIYSPINGYITKVNVNIGKYVNPSDVLFEIVNPADIHLALNVFEKDINKLRIGQQLVAYTNNNPAKKYPCKIILTGKELSQDRNIEVHCHFEQYDDKLIPGMFMNAEIETENNNAYTLPADAIVSYENKQGVFIDKGNKTFEIIEIKTGNTENGYTEIILNDTSMLGNASFVTNGAYSLLMKMKNTEEEE
ncbi:MAG: efflux RND transporter periplasmic adaptor subunit [Panacibacter sp.]